MTAVLTLIPAPAPETSEWFSVAELADLALPGLPADKRALNRRAREERWQMRVDSAGALLSRPRAGRGGGTEFHLSLLPAAAQLELARRGLAAERQETDAERAATAGSWRWFEAQSDKARAEAQRRLAIVNEIDLLERAGLTRTAAVGEASRRHGASPGTLWAWLKMITGVAAADRLPALAPRHRPGGREAEIDPFLWNLFLSDALRLSGASLAGCYDEVALKAAEMGIEIPSQAAFRRRLKREVDPNVIRLAREGEEALRRSLPTQRRTVAHLHALQCVNLDGHVWDVFVMPPDGGNRPIRPVMIAIQDVYSRKVLAWRIATSENSVTTRLTFADLFENYGIPKECVIDNGRAFNSKWLTGGMKTRFRFKIRPEDPVGLLVGLDILVHPTLPYRGQSKPIERAFRDMCDKIAKRACFDGAYTGNNPTAKPENYGSKAVPWDYFVEQVSIGIHKHNAKLFRQTEMARGRSFDQVFFESYATAPIGKVLPEQLRMALLTADQVTVNGQTGEIQLYGNRYWSEGSGQLHGQKVTVRFDPDNLARDIHLYDAKGRYLTAAQMIADTGFLDVAAAKQAAKFLSTQRKRIRDGLQAEQLLSAGEVARLQAGAQQVHLPEPAVLRPVRHKGHTAAALKVTRQERTERDEREAQVFSILSRRRDED